MALASTPRDPRSVVTPDAFELSPDLLGLRLAPPGRRLAAILIDLVVIGIITVITKSFALILGVLVAVLFIRAGFKRTPLRASVFDRAMRASVGCLGVLVAIVTAALWAAFGIGGGSSRGVSVRVEPDLGSAGLQGVLVGAIGSRAIASGFAEAESISEVESMTRDFMEAAEGLGVSQAALRAMLLEAVPEDAGWAGEAPALFDRLLPLATPPDLAEPIESRDAAAIRDGVTLYTTAEALESYAALLQRREPLGETDRVLLIALEERLLTDVAADTLAALAARVERLEDDVDDLERDLARAQAELRRAEGGAGFFGTLRDLVDELGFGFGWAALYTTVMLSWWRGQTLGKRLLRIRVLRLDGGPITWWVAFERAGGYAAGFATGLLGFAQIFWDANRQAIHDRIVGTVVVLDGAPKALDWESAL
jgi:uncharacterized RDD family membrane protein YckC